MTRTPQTLLDLDHQLEDLRRNVDMTPTNRNGIAALMDELLAELIDMEDAGQDITTALREWV